MTCIKTGCHAYLAEYDEWIYGDAHEFDPKYNAVEAAYNQFDVGSIFAFRVAQRNVRAPLMKVKHFTIHNVLADWRDTPYGTILATSVTNHGYAGVPL